jgi:hypothetical protein
VRLVPEFRRSGQVQPTEVLDQGAAAMRVSNMNQPANPAALPRAVIYVRVSTKEQAERGAALADGDLANGPLQCLVPRRQSAPPAGPGRRLGQAGASDAGSAAGEAAASPLPGRHPDRPPQARAGSDRSRAGSRGEDAGRQARTARACRALQQALALLDNAHGQYPSAPGMVRRHMNQAIFARLWLVEEEIAGADLTQAYRRPLADDLAGEIAAEETREQTERSRTKDLWITGWKIKGKRRNRPM